MTVPPPTHSSSSDLIPAPEPDAFTRKIPTHPHPAETGAEALGRDIAHELLLRLPPPLTDLTYRENPWDRRPCPQAQFYDLTISGHQIRITAYQALSPHTRDTHTVFAITLDQHPVPFDRAPIDPLPRQLAYALWSAHLDQPEHPHPLTTNPSDTSPQETP